MDHRIHQLKMTYVIDPEVQVWRNPAIQDIQSWTKDVLSEVLDKAFSELPDDQLHIIQSCHIDLEVKESDFYSPLWFDSLVKKIKAQIESSIQKDENKVVPNTLNIWYAFVHFLNEGYWPWWYESIQSINTSKLYLEYFERLCANDHSLKDTNGITVKGWQRWANHVLESINVNDLLQYCEWNADVVHFTKLVLSCAHNASSIVKGELLRSILSKEIANDWLHTLHAFIRTQPSQVVSEIMASSQPVFSQSTWWQSLNFTTVVFNAQTAQRLNESDGCEVKAESQEKTTEVIRINNAGIVIVAPFLPTLLERLQLKQADTILNPSKCLRLLHYACTGLDEFDEGHWGLFKILLGIDIDVVIEPGAPLIEKDLREVDQMLQAVITNWSAIKNTSISGLRANFINRKGVITVYEQQYQLRVERETMDILLNQLPWSFQMIKWPWMTGILMTQWDY